jgi:hypothetical protein
MAEFLVIWPVCRMGLVLWQKTVRRLTGYEGLRFQTDGRQASEVAIAADVLNRMLELGRPEYVRIA